MSQQIIDEAIKAAAPDHVAAAKRAFRVFIHSVGCKEVVRIVVRDHVYKAILEQVEAMSDALDQPFLPVDELRLMGVELQSSVGEDEQAYQIARRLGLDVLQKLEAEIANRKLAYLSTGGKMMDDSEVIRRLIDLYRPMFLAAQQQGLTIDYKTCLELVARHGER